MLQHGLQAMSGVELAVPIVKADRPYKAALEQRYEEFLTAT